MGTISKLHHIDLEDGKFAQTSLQDLQDVFTEIERQQPKKIILHYHGGLVNRAAGHASAEKLIDAYQATGAYPIFTMWNSRGTVITKNLDEIGQEKVFRQMVRRVGQFVVGKIFESATGGLGARGATQPLELTPITKFPSDLVKLEATLRERSQEPDAGAEELEPLSAEQEKQIEKALKKDKRLQRETQKIANEINTQKNLVPADGGKNIATTQTETTLMSTAVLAEIESEMVDPSARSLTFWTTMVRYGVKITRAVIKRYRDETHHELYTTIVEEVLRALYLDNLGILAWNLMKNDTADRF